MRRRRSAYLAAALAATTLVLAPAVAEARVGGRSSSGSRGSQTYTAPPATNTAPGQARSFDRTQTAPAAQPGAAAPARAPGVGAPANAARPGFGGALMGGLLGAGLFGLLLGGGFLSGLGTLAGFLGFLLQLAIIGGLVYLLVRLLRGRQQQQPAMAGLPRGMTGGAPAAASRGLGVGHARQASGAALGGGAAVAATRPAITPIQVTAADRETFGRMLVEVNEAWSRQDRSALRRLSTPEMASYFEGDLRDLAARGWTNRTTDLRLESGDIAEAWREADGTEYATAAMRFSLVDVTTDAAGAAVEGHPTERQTATELWTFSRRGPGNDWALSAIQQTGRG